jgi:hypothetical protein
MDDRRWAGAAVGILIAHNLVQNRFLNERGYVSGNLAVSGLLVGIGRASGLSWEEMGLGPGDLRQGLRLGAAASASGAALALMAISHPQTRAVLRDERAMVTSDRGGWRRVLLRFPLGTALFEEVAFRGVLPALLRQTHRSGSAEALSAAAFGLWHLIPTGRALSGNPLGRDVSVAQRMALILGGSMAAGASGLGLARMRRNTGSLLAPWLVHSSFNSLSYLAGVAALRLGDDRRKHMGDVEI